MNRWVNIYNKLDCLFEWYNKFKCPSRTTLVTTKDLLIYLDKEGYPAPSMLTASEQDDLELSWDYSLVYIKISIKEKRKRLEIFFDTNLIVNKQWE